MLELEAVPHRTVDLPFRVNLASANGDTNDYGLDASPSSVSEQYTLTAGATQAFTVVTADNDGDRIDDTVTVTTLTRELTGTQRELVTYELDVVDQHKLPKITLGDITIPDPADSTKKLKVNSIPEGTIGTVTLVADRGTTTDDVPDDEKITVALARADSSTADAGDFTLGGSPVTIPVSPKDSGTFTLDVDADEDIGEESLMLMVTVAGDPLKKYGENPDDPYDLGPILFTEGTDTKISAKSYEDIKKATDAARAEGAGDNKLWEPGETLTLMAEQLFTYPATTSVVLGNFVADDPAVLSGSTSNDMVTITAMGETGAEGSPISITATVVPTSSSLEVTQTTSNVVTIKFPIVVDAPMIVAKDNVQAVADAAVLKAAADSANEIWEPAPNGEVAMIALSDLFDVPESIEPRYLAESSTGSVDAAVNDLHDDAGARSRKGRDGHDHRDGGGYGPTGERGLRRVRCRGRGAGVAAGEVAGRCGHGVHGRGCRLPGGGRSRHHGRHEHALRGC